MKCNQIQELAADWLNDRMSGEGKEAFARHLEECEDCRREIEEMGALWGKMDAALDAEPGPELERKFNAMLEAYTHGFRTASAPEPKTVRFNFSFGAWRPLFQAAAAILLIAMGVLLGREMEHGKLKDMEVANLRQEMAQMHEMVTISLMTQSSAIDRLQGVSMTSEMGAPDDRLLDALIKTLDTDPDVNVRMAAVDALGRYSDRTRVQGALVSALSRQNSPLVQVSLIDLLVAKRAPGAKEALKTLIEQKNSLEPVKARARAGLDKLI